MTHDGLWNVTHCLIDSLLRGAFYGLPPQLLNLLLLVRLCTSPHSRRYGVTITGLLVTVYPVCHTKCLAMSHPFNEISSGWTTLARTLLEKVVLTGAQ